jgi:hypothetical protein
MWHKHRWEATHVQYQPPIPLGFTSENLPSEVMQSILWGVTVLMERCKSCGKRQATRIVGDAREMS